MSLMRFGFPQMLAVSVALHGGLVAGYGLAHSHTTPAALAATPETKTTTLIILASEDTPGVSRSKPQSIAATHQTANVPIVSASPSPQLTEKKISAATPPPSLALEANPNAHVRALPPEAVLDPVSAPQLDGKNGVVFLLDVSGSMYEPFAGSTRLAFAREELARRIRDLGDGTPFAITLYGETACNSGPLVAANDATRDAAVRFIMRDVDCGGGTNLPAGFISARQLGAGRFVLITDGDLNISMADLMPKAKDILGPKGHCPGLTIVGVSPRPHTTDGIILRELAGQQGGTYLAEQIEGGSSLLTSNKTETVTP